MIMGHTISEKIEIKRIGEVKMIMSHTISEEVEKKRIDEGQKSKSVGKNHERWSKIKKLVEK
jgi:hypothetical protein